MIHEFVYKTIGSCEISLDVHLPSTHVSNPLPILIWFHGGGLLQGTRKSVAPHMLRGVESQQYCLVAVDYRLAPQTTLAEIVSDALDAVRFVRRQLSFRLDTATIYSGDISVSGSSAGGYLALLVALRDSKLRSCLAIYPITNPLGSFFTTPHEQIACDENELQPFLDQSAQVQSFSLPQSPRNGLYNYMLKSANLAQLLRLSESQNGRASEFIVASEIREKQERHLMCPVYIVHGNADTAVGIEQSYDVRQALQEIDSEVVFEEVEGEEHGYDKQPEITMDSMYEFFAKHVLHQPPEKTEVSWSSSFTTSGTSDSCRSDKDQSSSEAAMATTPSDSYDSHLGTDSPSPQSDLDSSSESGSDASTLSSDSYASTTDAEEHWAQSMHELSLVLNLIFLPLAGKYFGRQFAFWGWAKWITWRQSGSIILQDKVLQRVTSAAIAGLS